MIHKNDHYEVEITGITAEGNGIAKIDGFIVFVPQTAVGDIVKIKIVKVLKNYGFGIIEQIVFPAKDRIENDCSVFRQCGGCCWRHISYSSELEIKWQQVRDCFERLGGFSLPPQPIVGSEKVVGYRNKAQFPVGIDNTGKAIAGFFAKRSHRIISCLDCKLQPPVFNQIVKSVLDFINKYQITVYQEQAHTGIIRHIYLREAEATKEIMLCLVCAKKQFPHQKEFCETMLSEFPQIKSIILNYNPDKTNVILGKTCFTIAGSDTITDILCGVQVQISPLSFYQVNKEQAQRLYQKAIIYAQLSDQDILLDLYCGIGTIGLSAAKRVKMLIGVEIIPQAVENAKENARLNGFENTRFLCADCKAAVKQLEEEHIKTDVIIVDPPRKGCDKDVIESICRIAPRKLIMISCNPATAARDCKLLCEQGYQIEEYTPFDLFPRTSAIECVVKLIK